MYTDDYNEDEVQEEKVIVEKSNNLNIKKIIIILIAVLIVGLIAYFLYKNSSNGGKTDNYVISLYPENIIIPLGETKSISYDLRNNGEIIPNANIRLTVGNETIAKIDNLSITGLSYGTTVLTATYIDSKGRNIEQIKEITVADGDKDVTVDSISIPAGDLQLPFNGTYTIPLTIEPSNGFIEKKSFTSSNNNVVIVDNKGVVTAVSEGNASIIIDVNGKFKKQLKVYVTSDAEISEIVVRPTKITINNAIDKITRGESATLTYTVIPEDANKENIKWSSSDSNIITVDNTGKIKAIKPGSATIKVEAGNVTDSVRIEVISEIVQVTDIDLSVNELTLTPGGIQMIIPTVIPSNATDKTLTYTSSNESIVKVSSTTDGTTIEAIGEGTASIIIKSSNGIEKTITVTVIKNSEPEPSSSGNSGGSSCKKTCPDGQYVSKCKCVKCEAGYYCKNGKKNQCSSGYTSKEGASSCTRSTCPAGQGLDPSATTGCSACASGYVSPATSGNCTKCTSGKIPNSTKSSCVSCSGIANCTIYGGDGATCKCTSCKSGYNLSSDGKTCVKVTCCSTCNGNSYCLAHCSKSC